MKGMQRIVKTMIVIAVVFQAVNLANAQDNFEFWPNADYDPSIPTLEQVAGHDFGEEITAPSDIVRYFEALAEAAPERTRLVEYAVSWEGRPLIVLVIGSAERMARLDAINICVPTPLTRSKDPDVSHMARALEEIRRRLRSGQLIVLGSTSRARIFKRLLGDTALHCLRNADVPLFLTR